MRDRYIQKMKKVNNSNVRNGATSLAEEVAPLARDVCLELCETNTTQGTKTAVAQRGADRALDVYFGVRAYCARWGATLG